MSNVFAPILPPGGASTYTAPGSSSGGSSSDNGSSSSGANNGSNRTFIEFAIAGAIVVASVAIAERVSKGAAWGLVLLIFMGALVLHPALINTLTKLASGG